MTLLEKLTGRLTAQNVFLDENTGGKGKYFKARFLQPGLVKYSFGVCVLEKDTIDKFIQGFVGCPVIINHQDVTNENAKELSCGNICHIWYDDSDGWYWGDGIIDDEEAINKINEGYNVSCQYEITEYSNNTTNALHNGNPYDKVILNGKPEHLAIVKTPRYENAMIAMNALDKTEEDMKAENGFVTLDELDEDGNRKVIWIPGNVLSNTARKRVLAVTDNFKEGDETKYDFSHTRVKPSNDQINYLKNTLKEIEGTYKFKGVAQIEISSELNKGSLGVCFSPSNTSLISLSPQLYNGKYSQEKYDSGVKSGWHPKGTGDFIKSVLVHEVGHAITCNSKDEKFWDKVDKIRSDYMKNISKKDVDNPDFISNYARTNRFEFVAEAFCQGHLSKKYGKYTKQIMDLMSEHFAKNKQLKLAVNESKDKDDDMWVEGFGLGYPIDEEAYEEFKELQEKEMEKEEKENKAKNSMTNVIKQAINEIKETDMFNKLFRKDKQMEKDEMKSLFIECLQECLKAKNEEEKEEADKEEDKKEEKEAENKCKNEVVDKRDIIRQIMAIAGKEEASEDVKTIAKLAEKLAYDKSEADDKADNCKGKNEDKEKEEDKEEAKNKAKNAIEEMKAMFTQTEVRQAASNYVSRADAIELGNELF